MMNRHTQGYMLFVWFGFPCIPTAAGGYDDRLYNRCVSANGTAKWKQYNKRYKYRRLAVPGDIKSFCSQNTSFAVINPGASWLSMNKLAPLLPHHFLLLNKSNIFISC